MKRDYLMLACPNLKKEINQTMAEYSLSYDVEFLPEELHQSSDKLRAYLDSYLKQLSDVETVLLPMGRCGNGTIGIHSYRSTLVLPRCEDCINLLLSKGKLADVERPDKTYFFTDGWLDGERSFVREFDYTMERFGEEMGAEVTRMIYANYKQFAYIDTGTGNFQDAAAVVEPLSRVTGVKSARLDGPYRTLKKMIRCEFDPEEFIIVPPGSTVDESFWME